MKTDIEYAALVMGWTSVCMPEGADEWSPLDDDGDSRRLEVACQRWMMDGESVVPSPVWQHDSWLDDARRAGSSEEYRAAVFALAVAIGKVMEGNDNAD